VPAGQTAQAESASVRELTTAIDRFIDAYNDRCQPFTWTKDADHLLAKIKRP
jgi:hypothetical protein